MTLRWSKRSAWVHKDEHVPLNLKEYKIWGERELLFITNSELLIIARSCENMSRLSSQDGFNTAYLKLVLSVLVSCFSVEFHFYWDEKN